MLLLKESYNLTSNPSVIICKKFDLILILNYQIKSSLLYKKIFGKSKDIEIRYETAM